MKKPKSGIDRFMANFQDWEVDTASFRQERQTPEERQAARKERRLKRRGVEPDTEVPTPRMRPY